MNFVENIKANSVDDLEFWAEEQFIHQGITEVELPSSEFSRVWRIVYQYPTWRDPDADCTRVSLEITDFFMQKHIFYFHKTKKEESVNQSVDFTCYCPKDNFRWGGKGCECGAAKREKEHKYGKRG